jgi:hypothetical protein
MNSNSRNDVVVSGHLVPNEHLFFLGGFLMDLTVTFSEDLFLYAYEEECGEYPVCLVKGWKKIFDDPKSSYKPVLFKWMWANSLTDNKNSYCNFEYALEAYDMDGKSMNKYLGYNFLAGGLYLAKLDQNMLRFVFNANNSFYDWNDGTYRLQSWNVMTRDPLTDIGRLENSVNRSVVSFVDSTTTLDGMPYGFSDEKKDNTLNFTPIPVEWVTKTGKTDMTYENSLLFQQCYRYQKGGNNSPSFCNSNYSSDDFSANMGATTNNLATKSNYIPFFVSHAGCGEAMVSEVKVDTLGNFIDLDSNFGNTSDGYCIRNSSGEFEEFLQPPGCDSCEECKNCENCSDDDECKNCENCSNCKNCENIDEFECKKCTTSNCANLCSQISNDPICLSSVCGKCNPTNCPSSFVGYTKGECTKCENTKCENTKCESSGLPYWVWIVIGSLGFLVLLLTFLLFYLSRGKNTRGKKKKGEPKPFRENEITTSPNKMYSSGGFSTMNTIPAPHTDF